jgi:hypothetical protein
MFLTTTKEVERSAYDFTILLIICALPVMSLPRVYTTPVPAQPVLLDVRNEVVRQSIF